MSANTFAQLAMQALNAGEPERAMDFFAQALEAAQRPRPDLLHGLGVVLLQVGKPGEAKPLLEQAVEQGWSTGADPGLIQECQLALAAACEDLDDPAGALASYERVLETDGHHNKALAGRGHLLLSMGRLDDGLADLDHYTAHGHDTQEYVDAAKALATAVREFKNVGDATVFLRAHRESYVGFFDQTVAEMAQKGWIAECARMKRDEAGNVVPSIPEEARDYAAVRVDLVDPSTGQAGQIGDQPMVVAVGGFEALAQAPVLFRAEEESRFALFVSSQCPWDQLPIRVEVAAGDAVPAVEPVVARWYTDGWNGAFGTPESGRFHYISDPVPLLDGQAVLFHVDMGRAELSSLEALFTALASVGAKRVVLGRAQI